MDRREKPDSSDESLIPEEREYYGNKYEDPCSQIFQVWKTLVIVLVPIVLLPIPVIWPEKVELTFSPTHFNAK